MKIFVGENRQDTRASGIYEGLIFQGYKCVQMVWSSIPFSSELWVEAGDKFGKIRLHEAVLKKYEN